MAKLLQICFLFLFAFVAATSSGQETTQTTRINLKFKNHGVKSGKIQNGTSWTSDNKVSGVAQKFHVAEVETHIAGKQDLPFYTLCFPEGTDLGLATDELLSTGEVEYAEPDYIGTGGGQPVVPNDLYYSRQWGLKNDGSFSYSPAVAGADIKMEAAWAIETGDSSVVVAILDSGLKLDHPEFQGRIWNNSAEISGNGNDDDKNGLIDDVNGWDYANGDNNPTDDYGHGTNVAGIAGANGNNSIGYAGVDWNCKLMPLKGLDSNNSGYYSWWASAIYYAVDNGADVINMSMGGTSNSTTLSNAVNYALSHNVSIVACMMNANSNTVYYPAGFPGVIAVGSTNPNDSRSTPFFWSNTSGSNYGSHISVVAPGNYIFGLSNQSNTNFNSYWGGTSQATPLVTGLVSLLLARKPGLTPAQLKTIIESTADDKVGNSLEDVPGWDQYYGYGRINAYKALSSVNTFSPDFPLPGLSVFPNPFTTKAVLRFGTRLGNATVSILNPLGQVVKEISAVDGDNVTLDRARMAPGLYFIRVMENGKPFATAKVVVSD
jgi:subtilisin family serine protease